MSEPRPPFLSAEWRHLVMLNWDVARDILAPLVPAGTTLDAWYAVQRDGSTAEYRVDHPR